MDHLLALVVSPFAQSRRIVPEMRTTSLDIEMAATVLAVTILAEKIVPSAILATSKLTVVLALQIGSTSLVVRLLVMPRMFARIMVMLPAIKIRDAFVSALLNGRQISPTRQLVTMSQFA